MINAHVWSVLALAIVIILIIYLVIEIVICRKQRRSLERFSEESTPTAPAATVSVPLPQRACDTLLNPLETQQKKQQMFRYRLLKATPETNPELDHAKYDYCYIRDFDHKTSNEYAPSCDARLSKIYSNSMIKRTLLADVRDQDSMLNVPRQVCLMELERDKVNVNNINDFVRDLNGVDNADFVEDLKSYRTEIALLQKNNAELSTAVTDMHSRLADTQQTANKEATVAKQATVDLRIHQLQQQSDASNSVIIIDDKGDTIYSTNAPTTFDMSKFKGQVRSVILPKQNSFRVIITSPRGEFTYTKTEMNTSQAGLEVQRIRVL